MKADNPFDKMFGDQQQRIPEDVKEGLVFVVDTMDLCFAGACSVFEKKATPAHALAIYDRVVERMLYKRVCDLVDQADSENG